MASSSHKRPITRHRDHLACIECRRKKLKCDRAAPCSACTRRDGGFSCSYQRSTTGFEAERERRKKAEGRLEHLEQLVQQLSKSGRQAENAPPLASASTAANTTSDESSSLEADSVSGAATSSRDVVYNGATHWSAMLQDIEELKSAISEPASFLETDGIVHPQQVDGTSDTAILFGAGPTLTFEQVLTHYLPPRQEADRLVATYFRSRAVKAPFLHHAHFQKRYQAFWANTSAAPVLWVSILFTVLHVATTSLGTSAVADRQYSVGAAHCLAIGKYYQPRQYAVEALLLFGHIKCFTRLDVSEDIGSIIGLVARTAMRAGYHRDPARLPISPFEKEMRRRVWSTLLQVELLISFQLGMPSSIQPGSHDVPLPANLQDADFDEETTEMPPDRPDTEETDAMFYNAKYRLATAFEKVHRHASTGHSNVFSATDEQTIASLDAEVHRTYLALPLIYRQKPVSESMFDSQSLILARFCINMIHAKCLCVLHRPYVAAGRTPSLLTCGEASSSIVRHFVDAYHEFEPGGQIELQRWFMSAITWHDFLLGTTALCLVLCSAQQHGMFADIDLAGSFALLESASAVLARHAAQSRDTLQVRNVVETALARFAPLVPAAGSFGAGQASTSSGKGADDSSASRTISAGVEYDWTANFSQPMVDDSWSWLEEFLQNEAVDFAGSVHVPYANVS